MKIPNAILEFLLTIEWLVEWPFLSDPLTADLHTTKLVFFHSCVSDLVSVVYITMASILTGNRHDGVSIRQSTLAKEHNRISETTHRCWCRCNYSESTAHDAEALCLC